jgi:hypothetical protein
MSEKKFAIVGPISMEPFWEPVEKHAAALGWAVISWCQLYEELGLLFATLTSPDNRAAALAAWHQVRSDRTQRHMLRAVVGNSLEEKPLVKKYILWAIGKLDSMEDGRNNAVHAPVGIALEAAGIVVIPLDEAENPRAEALKGKDLEVEFRRYQRNTDALRSFMRALRARVPLGVSSDHALPEKPELLSYEQAIAQMRESSASAPPPSRPA